MRAERLYSIALDILHDLEQTKLIERLTDLVDALDDLGASATTTNEEAVTSARSAVFAAIAASEVKDYPPAMWDIIVQMQIDQLYGAKLMSGIDDDMRGVGITPSAARDAVKARLGFVENLSEESRNLTRALSYFEVKPDDLPAGQFETMIQIPGAAIDDELGRLGKEAQRLNAILGVFTEIATGARAPIKVRALGSSNPTFFLDSLPATAVLIATSIERIAAFYAQIQGIIKTHRDMKAQNVPIPVVEGMKQHIDESIKSGLDSIAKLIERESMKAVPTERKQELRLELKKSLYEIARRVDEGDVFDVRGAPLDEPEEGVEATPQRDEANRAYQVVAEARPRIQHFQVEDEPILSLPRPDEE